MAGTDISYSGPVVFTFVPAMDGKPWYFRIHDSFTVQWKMHPAIIVPRRFETDLASIPQILQNVIPLVGNHIQAAVVHDLCYRHQIGVSKEDADDMFADGMERLGVPAWQRHAMYQAVNWFGGSSFKGG